jgi:hypothetical protein
MPITDSEKYLALFGTDSTKLEKALKYAHDIRKFEIDLYWRRGTYFWTFIALAFTGYSLLEKEYIASDHLEFTLQFTTACLGFLFSWAWHCVNRGSHFWQRNWETHVDLLEDKVTGPLYKTVLTTQDSNFCNPIAPYSFSPAKINHILSLVVSGVWIYLVFHTFAEAGPTISNRDWPTIVVIGALTIIGAFFILCQKFTNEKYIDFSGSTRKTRED